MFPSFYSMKCDGHKLYYYCNNLKTNQFIILILMPNEINVLSWHIFLDGYIKILIRPTKYKINLSRRNCFSDWAHHSSKCIMLFLPTSFVSRIRILRYSSILGTKFGDGPSSRPWQPGAECTLRLASEEMLVKLLFSIPVYVSTQLCSVSFELCRNQFLLRYVRLCS